MWMMPPSERSGGSADQHRSGFPETGRKDNYTHPHVLVIDEVGYLTYEPDAANVLFHVMNDRHKFTPSDG